MNNDEKWMQIAINESIASKSNDEIPVGAVIVRNGELIAQAHNQPISTNDPTAHAEILAIRKAGKKEKNYRFLINSFTNKITCNFSIAQSISH